MLEAGRWHNKLKSRVSEAVGAAETSDMVSTGLKSLSKWGGGFSRKVAKVSSSVPKAASVVSETVVPDQHPDECDDQQVDAATAARHARMDRLGKE